MTISKEVLDELLSGVENADDLLGNQGLMKELKVRLMERMLGAVALGVSKDGVREVLGLWIADNEGAKFWLRGPDRRSGRR